MNPYEPYPLQWPIGRARTPDARRRKSKFQLTQRGAARKRLLDELRRFKARNVVLSTMLPTRADGLFYAANREPDDPGIAVYFIRNGQPYAMACDSYLTIAENVRALEATIEALRRIERHGAGALLEQAMTGFRALPPARHDGTAWWRTLGIPQIPMRLADAEEAFRSRTKALHPDRGAEDGTEIRALNEAIGQAREFFAQS